MNLKFQFDRFLSSNTHFFIRTSKFCRGSLFFIFWLLQPQFVLLKFVLISVSGLKWWEIKTKLTRHWKQCYIIVRIYVFWGDLRSFIYCKLSDHCILSSVQSSPTGCRGHLFLLPNNLKVKWQYIYIYSIGWETVLLYFYCEHCEPKLQDSVKFFQLETFSLFFQPQPELVVKLFAPIEIVNFRIVINFKIWTVALWYIWKQLKLRLA